MQILVTGASGFIGQHTVAELVAAGHQVTTLHRGPALADSLPDGPSVRHLRLDVLSTEARQADSLAVGVVHVGGRGVVQASFLEPVEFSQLNAMGTLNVLEGARSSRAHVVFASTQRVYQPTEGPIPEDAPVTIATFPSRAGSLFIFMLFGPLLIKTFV